jgi:hypothetical protein
MEGLALNSGIFMASANSKNARRLFRRKEKLSKVSHTQQRRNTAEKERECLNTSPGEASIKQPDAHNFCCQTQFSSLYIFFFQK